MKLLKFSLLNSLLFVCFNSAFGQNNVGIGTTTPDASSVLEMQATDKGVLVPRMTTVQRTAIASPANALLVYDTDFNCFYYFVTTTGWQNLCAGTAGPAGPQGPAGTNGIPGTTGLTGPAGATGPAGPTGATGPQGATGLSNTPGPTGPAGTNGTNGIDGINGAPGANGIDGAPGTNGTNGIDGIDGINGAPGPAGAAGPAGPIGATGLTGPIGATGPAGPVGCATADYIMKSNGTSATCTVTPIFEDVVNSRIGIATLTPTSKLEVSSGATADAIFGHSNQVGGYLGRETNITFGTPAQSLLGAGVYAANPAAGYTSSFSQSSGAATVAANISFSNVWIASYNYVENAATSTFNPPTIYGQLNNSSTTLGGFQNAIRGYSNKGTALGNAGYTVGGQFTANAQFQDAFGVVGQAFGGTTYSVGGYFEGNNYAGTNLAYAFAGGNVAGLARKITGTGSVAEIIPTPEHGRITLICPESPEYWYMDYGTVNLVNGRAHVDLDPILEDIIIVDASNPLKIFPQANILTCNGLAVINKTVNGFDIVEVNNGMSNGEVDYQIIAKPKTNYGEGRFPQAPGPAGMKEDPAAAKAKNQIDPSKIYHWPSDSEVYNYTLPKSEPEKSKKD